MTNYSIKVACAIMSVMNGIDDLKNYEKILSQSFKSHLSDMSVMNLKTSLILHSIASAQRDIYLNDVKNGISEIRDFKIGASAISDITDYINNCVISLTASIFELQDQDFIIDTDAIYSTADNDTERFLRATENENPMNLLYFSTKSLLLQNSNLIQNFSNLKTEIEKKSESKQQSIVIHADMLLTLAADNIQFMIKFYQMIKELLDAVNLSIAAYNHYQWEEKEDCANFLHRTFKEISADFKSIMEA